MASLSRSVSFFQPKSPRDCDNCRKLARINIDFRIDQEEFLDHKLSVEIEVPSQEEMGTRFPLSQAGNPTINARLLLEDE
jgi:tyrosinase